MAGQPSTRAKMPPKIQASANTKIGMTIQMNSTKTPNCFAIGMRFAEPSEPVTLRRMRARLDSRFFTGRGAPLMAAGQLCPVTRACSARRVLRLSQMQPAARLSSASRRAAHFSGAQRRRVAHRSSTAAAPASQHRAALRRREGGARRTGRRARAGPTRPAGGVPSDEGDLQRSDTCRLPRKQHGGVDVRAVTRKAWCMMPRRHDSLARRLTRASPHLHTSSRVHPRPACPAAFMAGHRTPPAAECGTTRAAWACPAPRRAQW